jgi:hypothetical protein
MNVMGSYPQDDDNSVDTTHSSKTVKWINFPKKEKITLPVYDSLEEWTSVKRSFIVHCLEQFGKEVLMVARASVPSKSHLSDQLLLSEIHRVLAETGLQDMVAPASLSSNSHHSAEELPACSVPATRMQDIGSDDWSDMSLSVTPSGAVALDALMENSSGSKGKSGMSMGGVSETK